jgi:hypothetical protein
VISLFVYPLGAFIPRRREAMECLEMDGNHIVDATMEAIRAHLEEMNKMELLMEMANNDYEEYDDDVVLDEFL